MFILLLLFFVGVVVRIFVNWRLLMQTHVIIASFCCCPVFVHHTVFRGLDWTSKTRTGKTRTTCFGNKFFIVLYGCTPHLVWLWKKRKKKKNVEKIYMWDARCDKDNFLVFYFFLYWSVFYKSAWLTSPRFTSRRLTSPHVHVLLVQSSSVQHSMPCLFFSSTLLDALNFRSDLPEWKQN